MQKRPLSFLVVAMCFVAHGLSAKHVNTLDHISAESLDAAQLIVSLSKSITNQLNPPATGAERTVTNATVSEDETTRTYYIEGQDVYHTGRVLSTFWIRLQKHITENNAYILSSDGDDPIPLVGHTLEPETQQLVGSLLNGLYDIAELDLEHRQVALKLVTLSNLDPWTYEIIGENQVCKHADLNTFKLVVSRIVERNRPSYHTELLLPYTLSPEERAAIESRDK